MQLAKLYGLENEMDRSVLHLMCAVKIDPENVEAYYLLGKGFEQLKKFGLAEKSYKRVLTLDTEALDTLLSLARLLAITGREKEAVECYLQCIQMDASCALAYQGLGILYLTVLREPELGRKYLAIAEKLK